MANVYVRSGAGGAGTGADWANAYTTLAAALTAKAAGDNFWVADDHAETQASAMTLTSPGTTSAPCTIMCVNRAGTVPPVSADLRTTATVTTTLGNAMNFAGFAYHYGITYSCGSGANNAKLTINSASAAAWQSFKSCALKSLGTTVAGGAITFGVNGVFANRIELDNTTLEFGATGGNISVQSAAFVWRNTASAIAGATLPTTLFSTQAGQGVTGIVENVDLSALSGTLVSTIGAPGRIVFSNCKFHASATVASAPNTANGLETIVVRSDGGATNYRHERYRYQGTQTVETTIVRTGGASDGTTPIAWKIVSTANAKWLAPFESLPMAVWLDTTSSVTLTVYGIAAALPTQDDIWIEASYLGSALTPIGTLATSGKADFLATGANLTADSSTWGGSTTAFKMALTFTPAMKGFVSVVVKVGGATKTLYIDPKIAVT